MVTGLGLFSGGLDSILAARLLQEQGIRVQLITFTTPFFGPAAAHKAAGQIGAPLHIVDITVPHFAMLKAPRHGYGRNMNPCIDCHALMFQQAGRLMPQCSADFLFSGEVLGERPMSQNRQSLNTIAKHSGFGELIIRPLSARLLPASRPESEGLVDRSRLLDLQGRSRKPQLELAVKLGVTGYPEPAGGCKLTDPAFSRRLRDLLRHSGDVTRTDLELLSIGRHLRISKHAKIIVGRNEQENAALHALRTDADFSLSIDDIPGPVVLIPGGADDAILSLAAAVCARYSDAHSLAEVTVSIYRGTILVGRVAASALDPAAIEHLRI